MIRFKKAKIDSQANFIKRLLHLTKSKNFAFSTTDFLFENSLSLKIFFLIFFSNLIFSQTYQRDLSKDSWQFSQEGKTEFLSAKIPGNIYTDLFNNKKISEPFYEDNEKQLQWIENENWLYKTQFHLSEKEFSHRNIELIFEGLDTFAKVFLNGKEILNAENMFRTWKVDAKNFLKVGENILEVQFFSAVKKGQEEAKKLPYTLPEKERIFVRKAQYQFGWDFAPRFSGVGIWKPIYLKFRNEAEILNVKHSQKIEKNSAIVNFSVDILAEDAGNYLLKINKKSQKVLLKKGLNKFEFPYEIKNPKLWWSNGLGKPNLYDFNIFLSKNEIPHNARNDIIDSKNLKIGIRTIELVQEKDKVGSSFYFKINGKPVYIKGANMVPPNAFPSDITKSDYENLVKEAQFANMNMLRIWGGGIYPDENFYNFCDENGILVWQDFMFACAMYPGDENFLKNVKHEVSDQVNRLQNHASLALWCGNNENDEGWKNWGWQKQFGYSQQDSTKIWTDYVKLFREVIPKTLDSVSAQKPIYWQSSPKNGWGRKIAYEEGDVHYWGVWWGQEPFEKYEEKVGRFVSEYGFQGIPNVETLRKISGNLSFEDSGIRNHQKHATGYETIRKQMELYYKNPENFEDFAYVSQLLQARGMQTAIEAHRRAKPYNMGTLFWQLNDSWQGTTWSSIDFYGNRKATFYQSKRSFEDVLISVKETETSYQIYLVNDKNIDFKGGLNLDIIDFKGKNLWNASGIEFIKANSSEMISELFKKDLQNFDVKNSVLKISFISNKADVEKHFYFSKPKDLVLEKPNIKIKKISDKIVEISTDVLAKEVYLQSENSVNFNDNFFDLLPHEKKIIYSKNPIGTLKIKTIFDVQ